VSARLRCDSGRHRLAAVSYALKLGGAAIAILALGVLGIVIFGNIWARVGVGAAIVVVFGGLLVFAWSVDRKGKKARAGIDELPRI
jgi:Flp pilus assembly protein TadB